MTLPIARDLAAAKVRVVTIAPGLFDTPMLGRAARGGAASLGAQVPHPPGSADRTSTGAGRPDRREPDAQRRDDPARRCVADDPALILGTLPERSARQDA